MMYKLWLSIQMKYINRQQNFGPIIIHVIIDNTNVMVFFVFVFFSGDHAVIIYIHLDWQCSIFVWNSYPFPVVLSGISIEILISC